MKWRGGVNVAALFLMIAGSAVICANARVDSLDHGLAAWLVQASPVLLLAGMLAVCVFALRLRVLAWIGLGLLTSGIAVSLLLLEEHGGSMGTMGWVSGLMLVTVVAPVSVGLCLVSAVFSLATAWDRDPEARRSLGLALAVGLVFTAAMIAGVLVRPGASSMLERLAQARGEDRVDILYDMTHMRDPALVAPMVQLLSDPDPEVRKLACMVIMSQGGASEAVPSLLAVLDREQDPEVRPWLARALGSAAHGDGESKDVVAARLVKLLRDPDGEMRRTAADCLGWLGNGAAVEPLIDALEDDDPLVVWQAREALLLITDQRFGEDPAQWREWLAQRGGAQ